MLKSINFNSIQLIIIKILKTNELYIEKDARRKSSTRPTQRTQPEVRGLHCEGVSTGFPGWKEYQD